MAGSTVTIRRDDSNQFRTWFSVVYSQLYISEIKRHCILLKLSKLTDYGLNSSLNIRN